ncbi:MAG: RebB family R body protein [Nannocystaceae bacterium]
MASGSQFMTLGYAQSLAAYNAVFAQQQAYITAQTASVADVLAILRP